MPIKHPINVFDTSFLNGTHLEVATHIIGIGQSFRAHRLSISRSPMESLTETRSCRPRPPKDPHRERRPMSSQALQGKSNLSGASFPEHYAGCCRSSWRDNLLRPSVPGDPNLESNWNQEWQFTKVKGGLLPTGLELGKIYYVRVRCFGHGGFGP